MREMVDDGMFPLPSFPLQPPLIAQLLPSPALLLNKLEMISC
jgi:hypothetical protein